MLEMHPERRPVRRSISIEKAGSRPRVKRPSTFFSVMLDTPTAHRRNLIRKSYKSIPLDSSLMTRLAVKSLNWPNVKNTFNEVNPAVKETLSKAIERHKDRSKIIQRKYILERIQFSIEQSVSCPFVYE